MLLTNYNESIATFVQPNTQIVLKSANVSDHSAWGFPGMQLGLYIQTPPRYAPYGYSSITFSITPTFLGQNTVYNISTGSPQVVNTRVVTANSQTMTDQEYFTLPMNAPSTGGNVTINIDLVPKVFNGMGFTTPDHVYDTLTVTIETPTVNSFVIGGAGGPTSKASHLDILNGYGFAPGDTATDQRKDVDYWSTVTNTTHYDLNMGFIQTVPSFAMKSTYTVPFYNVNIAGENLLDDTPTQSGVLYNDYAQRIWSQLGNSTTAPVNMPQLSNPVGDWPHFSQPASVTYGSKTTYLTQVSFDAKFLTSVVVDGGWMRGTIGSPAVPGLPIALSTAGWELHGSGTSTGTAPSLAWTVAMSIGESPLANPAPNIDWNATGDGVVKYLTWKGETYSLLVAGGLGGSSGMAFSRVESAPPETRPAHEMLLHRRHVPSRREAVSQRPRLVAQAALHRTLLETNL